MEIEKGKTPNGHTYIQFKDYWDVDCKLVVDKDFLRFTIKSGDTILASEFAVFSQEDIKTLLPYLQSFTQRGTLELRTFLPLQKLMMDWADLIKNFTPYDSGVSKEAWDTWHERLMRETDQYMATLSMTGIPELGSADFVAQITGLRQLVQQWLNTSQGGSLLEESMGRTASLIRQTADQDEKIKELEQLVKEYRTLHHEAESLENASQQHLYEECCEDVLYKTAQLLGEESKPPTPLQGGTTEKIYHRALETIREELTSFDPDGDDVNYDREKASEEILKIIGIAIGDEKVESAIPIAEQTAIIQEASEALAIQGKQIEALKHLVRGWGSLFEICPNFTLSELQEQTAQLLGEKPK